MEHSDFGVGGGISPIISGALHSYAGGVFYTLHSDTSLIREEWGNIGPLYLIGPTQSVSFP